MSEPESRRPARVGIEAGDLLRPRHAGMARYVDGLLTGLVELGFAGECEAWAPWRRAVRWFDRVPGIRWHYFGSRRPRHPPEVFHATACVFPEWRSKVEIATVHDLFAVREELALSEEETRRRAAYVLRADRLICVSAFTRDHVVARLGLPPGRMVVIRPAVHPHFAPATEEEKRRIRRRYALASEFFLFVGRDRPTKNLDRLVQAHALARTPIPLCFAGSHGRDTRSRLQRLVAEHGGAGTLRWLGDVADAELPGLLSCASALCMPSVFEGFGIPVLEAMACGTPVVTSAGQATEEAAGGHAVLVDPCSVESIAAGLLRSLEMTEAQRDAARRYATARRWSDVAAETLCVYRGETVPERSACAAAAGNAAAGSPGIPGGLAPGSGSPVSGRPVDAPSDAVLRP